MLKIKGETMTRITRTRWQTTARAACSICVLGVLALGMAGCSEGKADDAATQAQEHDRKNRRPGVLTERLDGVYAGYDENGYPVYVQILSASTRATADEALAIFSNELEAIEGFDRETILSAYPDEADPSIKTPAILFRLDISGDTPVLTTPRLLGRTGTVDRIWTRDEAFKRGPTDPMCEKLTIVGEADLDEDDLDEDDHDDATRIWYGPFMRPDGIDSRAIYTYYGPGGTPSVLGLTKRETLHEIIAEGIQRDEQGNIRICTSECLCCQ